MGSLQIDVFNQPFVIQANEDDEYLLKLLGYYKRIVGRIQRSDSLKSPLQVSALAGIILCDELYKEKSKAQLARGGENAGIFTDEEDSNEAERLTKLMIEKIEKALQ
ncbi:cell division protein ZapA [uncultured Treponema sp.]|uniref:cell division protein ZapA n=1 Tax=uncultured Treponema sp. TaxID=162155 RepID=UPI0025E5D593|nr:cell division protein ZapA [uncultured Treponema sp.]